MNTKHPLWKEKLKLEREISELTEIQRKNTRLVPLERPYKNGYYKTYDIRPDIKNRADAWVFEAIAKLVVIRIWGRDKRFRVKYKKGQHTVRRPGRRYINEKVYLSLAPAIKKHFRPTNRLDRDYSPFKKEYTSTVPEYYFVEKITPRYVTHELVCDVDVSKDIKEREMALDKNKFYEIWNFRHSAPSWYANFYNRADRAHNKRVVKQMARSIDVDYWDIGYLGFDSDVEEYFWKASEGELRHQHRHAATWNWM